VSLRGNVVKVISLP